MSQALLAGISRTTEPRTMLRRFLALDAAVTGANGLAYAAASGPTGRFLGVDDVLLLGVGVFLAVLGGAIGVLAARPHPPVPLVKAVIAANIVWPPLSLAALALWLEPTPAGAVWTVLQAVTVAGFAALQWSALKATARA
ncbi:hypothetical protein J7E88_03340 [Streptomyces sp. ISL-10]|uniref:hypothetical protein n=1 Tax=Streptomyces sp. ISL-10 TaxID=2819172 RepID=UPI001BECF790|nr:hypothetical protein [Streptomyces sp. ISL-10]MBT2364388.1 hypothetical protein [Streptomyces sp. ISL-10]